ncbi:alcohol dehydrogenase-like isoform X2 [Ptychodera flava]
MAARKRTMRCVKIVNPFPTEGQLFTDEEIPAVPEEGALLKVLFSGMCHSDVIMWNKPYTLPLTLGHEIVGSVYAIGRSASNQDSLKVGDSVIVFPWCGCTDCKPCLEGRSVYCDLPTPKHIEHGITVDGGYAEYVAVPKLTFLVKVPRTVPLQTAGMLGCGMLTAYNAVQTAMKKIDIILELKDKCGILIIGAGGLGLSAINLLAGLVPAMSDSVEVICADIMEKKLSLALKAGCHGIIHLKDGESGEERVSKIKSSFHNGGPHIVIDFVGSTHTMNISFKSLKKGGSILCVGLYGGNPEMPMRELILGTYDIHGFFTGNLRQMKELVDLVASGKIATIPYQVHRLEDAPKLIHRLKDGTIEGRAILAPHLE